MCARPRRGPGQSRRVGLRADGCPACHSRQPWLTGLVLLDRVRGSANPCRWPRCTEPSCGRRRAPPTREWGWSGPCRSPRRSSCRPPAVQVPEHIVQRTVLDQHHHDVIKSVGPIRCGHQPCLLGYHGHPVFLATVTGSRLVRAAAETRGASPRRACPVTHRQARWADASKTSFDRTWRRLHARPCRPRDVATG